MPNSSLHTMSGRQTISLALWWLPLIVAACALAQGELAPGKFLVAQRSLADPNFAESVVLLVARDGDGAMGLIVNRQMRIPISRLFREQREAKGGADLVYQGGPVGRTGILALVRARPKPEDARHIFADVHLISSKELLERTLAAGTESSRFRVYLGYAGWRPGQLEQEIQMDAWRVLPAEAGLVFDPEPGSLWQRLIERTERRIASRFPLWYCQQLGFRQ